MVKDNLKKEYVTVVLAVIILVLLVIGLIYLLGIKADELETPVDDTNFKQEELVVDVSKSKCSRNELNDLSSIANKVELDFFETEVFEGKGVDIDSENAPEVDIYRNVYAVTFKNMSDDIYLVIKNSKNVEEKTLTKKDVNKDNDVVYETLITDTLVDYSVEFHSNKYGCKDEIIRKVNFTVPIYNKNYHNIQCQFYPEFDYCQKYTYADILYLVDFNNALNKYIKSNKLTTVPIEANYEDYTKKTTTTASTKKTTSKKVKKKNGINLSAVAAFLIGILIILITATIIIKKRSEKK